jgi:hypothetical protein
MGVCECDRVEKKQAEVSNVKKKKDLRHPLIHRRVLG